MSAVIYWFRHDLRLQDNPALSAACHTALNAGVPLLPVYCHAPAQEKLTTWGFPRTGAHRQQFLRQCLDDVRDQLAAVGSDLLEFNGEAEQVLPTLVQQLGATHLFCEEIAAPEEQASLAKIIDAARTFNCEVNSVWQSSLFDIDALPLHPTQLPDVFTQFRQAVEKAQTKPRTPLPAPPRFPALARLNSSLTNTPISQTLNSKTNTDMRATTAKYAATPLDPRSSFPYQTAAFAGGERAALAHVQQYFARQLAHTYKATRNQLHGTDYSSKFSPWLTQGCISAPTIYAALQASEAAHGANESTYWLWFELLWRDYFRLLHLKYDRQLYRVQGLCQSDTDLPSTHSEAAFQRWCAGDTGNAFIDAGMRELSATGYLSNRMRQNVASFLIHDLACDWRAGAAWFESQLVDYDVYSNQGNWLYIAGRGTDPRGGSRFNTSKQAQDYDPDGHYQQLWSTP
jgi:deoxyribodipyrimidine photo-lyase